MTETTEILTLAGETFWMGTPIHLHKEVIVHEDGSMSLGRGFFWRLNNGTPQGWYPSCEEALEGAKQYIDSVLDEGGYWDE